MSDLPNRIHQAVAAAQDAFWEELAEHFPEATHGDFPPDAQLAFDEACMTAATIWVEGNLPSDKKSDHG